MLIITKDTQSKTQKGFTILELMVASAIFAVILLVIAVGVMSFTNNYYKGIISSETQSVARSIMSEVSQSVEFGQQFTSGTGNVNWYCIDNTLYAYAPGQQVTDNSPSQQLDQGYHGLLVDEAGACSSGPTAAIQKNLKSGNSGIAALGSGVRELLNQHMRVGVLNINTTNGNIYTIEIEVIYGDNDLLASTTNFANESCKSISGSQFCAVADLTTTVEKRL